MALERCEKGHHWDRAKHTTCPHCGVPGLALDPTEKNQPPGFGPDPGHTIVIDDGTDINPPVGWLVCIEGKDRGENYVIRAGNNSIGRSDLMKIYIQRDPGISRENHAFILYDRESNTYMIRPGDAAGLVYHNRGLVSTAIRLSPFDRIKLGNTTLVFVPLCHDFGDERDVRWW